MSTEFFNDQWRIPSNENQNKISNYSMDFDGSSTKIDLGSTIGNIGVSSTTISFWLNIPTSTSHQTVLSNRGSGGGWAIELVDDAGQYTISFFNASSSTSIRCGFSDFNTWAHIVFVRDGSANNKIYINGVSQTLTSNNENLTNIISSKTLTIGAQDPLSNGYYRFLNGKIDQLTIFDYALTDGTGGTVNQIAALYGSSSTGVGNPMSLSPKPVAYYPLGDQDAFNGTDYLVPNSSLKDYVFDFVANGDTISIPDSNDLDLSGTDFSISFWVNANSISSSQMILQKYSGSNGWAIYNQAGSKNTLDFYQAGAFFGLDPNNDIENNVWSHYVVTANVSASEYKVYKNGYLINTISRTVNITSSTQPLYIGSLGGTGFYYNGLLSNVSILNTALPATGSNSVETLYNNGSPLTSMSGFTSLQGWWKLDASDSYDSSTGNWTITDHSSNSNDGTSSGMTQANLVQSDLSFTSGYSPYALDFDGGNDKINLNSTVNLSNSWSVGFWFKTPATTSNNMTVFRGNSTNNEGEWSFFRYFSVSYLASGRFSTRLTSGGTSSFVALTPNVLDNLWHNLTITYNYSASEYKVYLDGNVCFSGVYDTSTGNTFNEIGTNEASWYWLGQLSNISIWNAALTSSQATEIYNEGVPSNLNNHSAYSNLVSWWQLGSNSSFNTNWTVLDEKGSNNGTSATMDEVDIVDGVGSYANGLGSGMGGDEVIGDAPYSSSNSLSVNMDVLDRVTDTPS